MTGEVIDRSGCSYTGKHGTYSQATKGLCTCPDAVEALRLYRKRRREGRLLPGYVDGTGTRRRIRALFAIGWPAHLLAAELGYRDGKAVRQLGDGRKLHRTTVLRIKALYERLSMTPGPSDISRRRAQRAGWAPPMAWEYRDMDDPKAYPSRGTHRRGPLQGEPNQSDIDDVIAGQQHLYTLQPRYRAGVIDKLTQWGLGCEAIAKRLDLEERTVLRYRAQLRAAKEAAAARDAVKVPA